ncbi:MAG: sugar porter family MFS transporter [Planctomycetes bacterium]|nr:sugar porter family MFS transporter [Planctomycetota bacterium]
MKLNGFLIKSALVASLGGLLFGFDTAVISGAEEALENVVFKATYENLANTFHYGFLTNVKFWHGFTTASALIGTILGALLVFKPSDTFGRKKTLIFLGFLYFISAVGSAYSWSWGSFVIFRLIGGLAVGGSSVVGPIYIAEISPAKKRGGLVALMQFNIVSGIFLAYVSNWYIGRMDLGAMEWRWMFGVEAFPAIAFSLLMLGNPLSPRWLLARDRESTATGIMEKLGVADVQGEVNEIKEAMAEDHHLKNEPFFCKKYMIPISLAFTIAAFNQLSGINALLYYTKRIFGMAGANSENALMQGVIVGAVMVVFTMLALLIIDKVGRKKLMLWGSIGYIASLGTVAWAFHTGQGGQLVLWAFIVFLAAHGFGQGAVIWVFISEIFPTSVRAKGQALGSFTHWFMCALIAWSFPIFATESRAGYVFGFYAIMMVLQLVWVILVMPETKGISLEQLQKKFIK